LQDGTDLMGARALYMQSDGIHPSAVGVEKIVDGIGPAVLSLIAQ
jgi:acyl-CoA thioesterase-1